MQYTNKQITNVLIFPESGIHVRNQLRQEATNNIQSSKLLENMLRGHALNAFGT